MILREQKLEMPSERSPQPEPPAYVEQPFRYQDRPKEEHADKSLRARYNRWESTLMTSFSSSGGGLAGGAGVA